MWVVSFAKGFSLMSQYSFLWHMGGKKKPLTCCFSNRELSYWQGMGWTFPPLQLDLFSWCRGTGERPNCVSRYEKWESVPIPPGQHNLQNYMQCLIYLCPYICIREQNELWPSLGHKEINIVVKESAPLPHSEPLLTVPTYCYLKYPISCFQELLPMGRIQISFTSE